MWWQLLRILILFQSLALAPGQYGIQEHFKHLYSPLRITPYYKNLNFELDKPDREVLKDTIYNALLYVKKVLSVIPGTGNLLLGREACLKSWTTGRNVGKCSAIKKDYVGEFCMDNFKIPDDHLGAFYTWTNNPLPDITYHMEGPGLKNTDFVLYIQAKTTKSCLANFDMQSENSLVAYATACKFDSNDRPLAGYINFCPSEFHSVKSDWNRLMLITIHEIFHALGFSKDLFPKFRDCRGSGTGIDCPFWGFPMVRETNTHHLLVTPSVVYHMQKHFDCNEMDFGGPLEVKNGVLESHWKGEILKGSIMASKIDKPEFTFVDPITLSVFEDTGWYYVNYSSAENYIWGKGKGCDFVKFESRAYGLTGCSSVAENVSCNYLQTHTIRCDDKTATKDIVVEDCRQVNHFTNSDYTLDRHHASTYNEYGRCLLSTLTRVSAFPSEHKVDSLKGMCFLVRCSSTGELQVKLKDSEWQECPSGSKIAMPLYDGVVLCPKTTDILCYQREKPVYLQELYIHETTTSAVRPYARIYNITRRPMYGRDSGRRRPPYENAGVKSECCMTIILALATVMVSGMCLFF